MTSVVAAVSVLVIAAAGGLLPSRARAAIVSAGSTDTAISFDVEVEEDAGELSAVLYNDFTRRVFPLTEGSNSLTAGDLTPGMRYTVAVVRPSALGDLTVDERAVETSLTPPVTQWLGIEHECTCNVDGYFHFTMDFRDENDRWSDFRATLTDTEGHVSECVFTDDLHGDRKIDMHLVGLESLGVEFDVDHGDQRIDVAIRAGLTGSTATFTVICRTSDPSDPGELVLYTAQVKI